MTRLRRKESLPSVPGIPISGGKYGDVVDERFDGEKTRLRKPWQHKSLSWYNKSGETQFYDGRVLVIDYCCHGAQKNGRTRIIAQEFRYLGGLEKFYSDKSRQEEAALRVIHVQNAPWAQAFFLKKFNLFHGDHLDELIGTDFGQWAMLQKAEQRAGKPILKGKTWPTQRDPWRGIRRTSFVLDYLKPYEVDGNSRLAAPVRSKDNAEATMMELNVFDDRYGSTCGYDVQVQRLSVYIQHSVDDDVPPPDDVRSPYDMSVDGNKEQQKFRGGPPYMQKTRLPRLDSLDNGSTVLLFDSSDSDDLKDCLIQARAKTESRWRRLTFYLPHEDLSSDEKLATHCTNVIITDILKAVATSWEDFLSKAETHMSILEDKIYESPADESRASELWHNSAMWLKLEKLVFVHGDAVKAIPSHLSDLTDSPELDVKWIEGIPEEFDKLAHLVDEDLIKPTANLNDLLYKSIGIRDSRFSIELNKSLWRLSWITFVFLPLTFVTGIFGMNVDLFSSHPSIWWYFIVSLPLMVLVLIGLDLLKKSVASHEQTPYQRGVYEHFFADMANTHPNLWTRGGPRRYVKPTGSMNKLRWRLLRFWFRPEKTIKRTPVDPDDATSNIGLGTWSRFKRMIARKWLSGMKIDETTLDEQSAALADLRQGVEVTELVTYSVPAATVEVEPSTHPVTEVAETNLKRIYPPQMIPAPLARTRSDSQASARPSSSGGSSGVMIEERDMSDREGDNEGYVRAIRRSIDGVAGIRDG